MGVHVTGGVNIGIASGGVEAKITLLQVEAPVSAVAEPVVNADPSSCSISIEIGLNGSVTIGALSGEIDLVASFGPCPFCYSTSYPLVQWSGESIAQTLFSVGPVTLTAIPLPDALCSTPIAASITVPGANAQTNIPYPLFASAQTKDGSQVNCSGFTWSVTPSETISGSGCNATITFTNVGSHTIRLNISDPIANPHGTITVVGSGSETVAVTPLAQGAHIVGITPALNSVIAPFDGQTVQLLNASAIQVTGEYEGATGTVNFLWTLTDGSGHTSTLTSKALPNNQSQAALNVGTNGNYTVTMTVTDSKGKPLGSTTTMIQSTVLL